MLRILVVLSLLLCSLNATRPALAQEPAAATPAEIVRQFISAFNNQDLELMGALLTEDAGWYYVDGADITPQDQSRESILSSMSDYFSDYPTVRSEISGITSLPPFVSVIEKVTWTRDGIEHTQSSMAVYQLDGARVKAVWYYPSVSSPN